MILKRYAVKFQRVLQLTSKCKDSCNRICMCRMIKVIETISPIVLNLIMNDSWLIIVNTNEWSNTEVEIWLISVPHNLMVLDYGIVLQIRHQ